MLNLKVNIKYSSVSSFFSIALFIRSLFALISHSSLKSHVIRMFYGASWWLERILNNNSNNNSIMYADKAFREKKTFTLYLRVCVVYLRTCTVAFEFTLNKESIQHEFSVFTSIKCYSQIVGPQHDTEKRAFHTQNISKNFFFLVHFCCWACVCFISDHRTV